jgi:hypothetical protein
MSQFFQSITLPLWQTLAVFQLFFKQMAQQSNKQPDIPFPALPFSTIF